jgi:hypothetical protein
MNVALIRGRPEGGDRKRGKGRALSSCQNVICELLPLTLVVKGVD